MNLESLAHNSVEWLRGSGPESDIVISTRIRLARNLASFPFSNRASNYQKGEIETLLRESLNKMDLSAKLGYFNLSTLSMLDRQFLVERQLISRELAGAEGPRGVAVVPQETISVMVNEEDHLRLQVMRSGFALDEAWQQIDKVDDIVEQKITYAFHDDFGYLTACPTNVGTGMPPASCCICRRWSSPSRSKRSSAPYRRLTWRSAACMAREAGPRGTSTRSPTR